MKKIVPLGFIGIFLVVVQLGQGYLEKRFIYTLYHIHIFFKYSSVHFIQSSDQLVNAISQDKN